MSAPEVNLKGVKLVALSIGSSKKEVRISPFFCQEDLLLTDVSFFITFVGGSGCSTLVSTTGVAM